MTNQDETIKQQLEHTIEKIWSTMCKTTDDVRILTEKYGMQAIDGLSNPTVDQMLENTKRLDEICNSIVSIIDGNVVKEYIDTRLLLNARQLFLHFQQMIIAYKVNNLDDFLAARDLLKSQVHF